MGDLGTANQGAVDAAETVRAAVQQWLGGITGDNFVNRIIANLAGAVVAALPSMVSWFFGSVFFGATELVAVFLEGLAQVRQQSQGGLNDVMAAAMTDVLGVQIAGSSLPTNVGDANNINLFQSIGSAVVNAMTRELGGTVQSAPGPGEVAAQRFMGRGLNFAINAAMLSVVSEICSLGFIKEFKEVGEEMQRALGLGRLMRQALHPIINALITLPYTRETNALYRPHLLAQREYLDAFYSGRMDEQTMRTALAQLGFSEALITELIAQHSPRLGVHQVDALIRWGKLDPTAGLNLLVAQGWPATHAQSELDSLHLSAADAQEEAYAAEILKLAQARQITTDVFSTLLQRLHMSPEKQQGFLNRLGVMLDSTSKRLTLGEMLYLLEKNLLTTTQLEDWIAAEGYTQDAGAMLELYFDSKVLDYQQALKIKEDKAKRAAATAAAKGQPAPPSIINP